MRFLRTLLLAPLGILVLATSARAAAVEVRPSEDRGTWEAWGTSLCWWAKVFGDREDIADLLFTTKTVRLLDTDLPGLGMNFARYNAGACSWNEIDGRRMVVSKIILPYRQMEGFWLDPKDPDPDSASWDWSVDKNQRAMLRMAKDRGADHLELFSNSPMWWMCANDNPSGAKNATDDNLRPDQHANFAIYLAEVARRAKEEWGTPFTTVSPYNEPVSRWWFADCKQEGCHVSRDVQEKFLPVLHQELTRRGLRDLVIAASDENTYDEAIDTWKSFRPATRKLVGRINVHGYQYENGRRDALHDTARRDKVVLWNSEYGCGEADGMKMARNIHLDFQYLRPTAWAYWQPFDGGGWGFIHTDMPRAEMRRINPKFHVFAQYSRHIRPGMKVLGTGSGDVVAAYDAKEQRLVLVVLNPGKEKPVAIDLTRFRSTGAVPARWVTETRGAARYEFRRDVKLDHGMLECDLPARSVVTIEVRRISP